MDFLTQIPYSVAEQLISLLGSPALQEIKLVCGAEKELEKLKATLETINAGLSCAEQQQETNKLVEDWIRRVSDVLYDADDFLDDVATEGLRKNVDPRGRIAREVFDFFSSSNQILFRVRMGHKIKEIRERLDDIENDMSRFSFISHKGDVKSGAGNNKRETDSGELKHKFIGREEEVEEIIELLLQPADQNLKNVSVVAIVGMGGLGKTTLAQKVYNDKRVEEYFSKRMWWVCVSEDFNVKTLLTKILKCFTRDDVSKLELEQLQRLLREELEGKKYLLVLDDVWNENKEKWDQLEKHLCSGAQGSKILVTTRSKRVTRIMGVDSNNLNELKGLKNDDSWNLFEQVAFGADKEGASSSRLLEVGRELVRERCKGVPLAIKTLGSAVLSYPDEAYWLSMKENDLIWSLANNENEEDSILPVLKLSYYHLPNHLKQCFAYFSVFPKDDEWPKEILIIFWLAQGYVQSSTGGTDLEEIAKMYLNELVSRFFFQETEADQRVKMHDLIHDLAQLISKCTCVTAHLDEQKTVPKEVRHISFLGKRVKSNEIINILKSIVKGKTRLRTLLVGDIDDEEETKSNFSGFVFSNFKCLRVLGILFPTVELPTSIRRLKHLRCLILRGCQFKKLPGTICNLLNLQTLFLVNCDYLEELPKDLKKLVRLRHLFIQVCPSLTSLPDCFRHLSSLQRLVIDGCYELSDKCTKDDGPDWWKIQHIPNICTDSQVIERWELRED